MIEFFILFQEYVKNSKHPFLPVTRVSQGQYFELFEAAFDDNRAAVSICSFRTSDVVGTVCVCFSFRLAAMFKVMETVL